VEHPARGSLVGALLTSSSVEDGGLDCLVELGLLTLALRDPCDRQQAHAWSCHVRSQLRQS